MVAAILDVAMQRRLVKMITHPVNLIKLLLFCCLLLIACSSELLKNKSADTSSVFSNET